MASIKKNYIYNTSLQILNIVIPLITTPYLSRILGASGIGLYSYSYSVAYYFVIFIMLGLNNYGNRLVAQSRDDDQRLSVQFWSLHVFQIITLIIVSICYFFYLRFFCRNILVGSIFYIYIFSAGFDINWLFYGLEKFKLTVLRSTIIKLITLIAIFLFVKTEEDVFLYALIFSIGMLVSQLALWPYVIKHIKYSKPSFKLIIGHLKPNLILFVPVISISIYRYMDKIMLGIITNKTEVGLYDSCDRIVQVPVILVASLGTVMLPRISNLVSKNEDAKSLNYLEKAFLFALTVSSALGFGIMGVASDFVPFFFGNGFEKCVILFQIITPSCLFIAFANVIRTQFLIPHKKDKIYIKSVLLGAILNLFINLLLIPKLGSIGAAIGTVFTEAMICIYQAFSVRKELLILQYIRNGIPVVFSGILMYLTIFHLHFDSLPLFLSLLIRIMIGVLVFSLIFTLFSFKNSSVKELFETIYRK